MEKWLSSGQGISPFTTPAQRSWMSDVLLVKAFLLFAPDGQVERSIGCR